MTHEEKVKISNFAVSAGMLIVALSDLAAALEIELSKHDKETKLSDDVLLPSLMSKYEKYLKEIGDLVQ